MSVDVTQTPAGGAPAAGASPAAPASPAVAPDTSVDRVASAVAALAELEAPPPDPNAPAPAASGEGKATPPERDGKGRFKADKGATKAEAPPADDSDEASDEADAKAEPAAGASDDEDDDEGAEAAGEGGEDDDDDGDESDADEGEGDEPDAKAEPPALAKERAKLARERAGLERDRTAFQAEVNAARGALIAVRRDLDNLERLKQGDPDAADALGVDVQELTLAYAQRGRPEAQASKREKELAAQLAAQKEQLDQLQAYAQSARLEGEKRAFLKQAARTEDFGRVAALAQKNPERLYSLALERANELRAKNIAPTAKLLFKGIERKLAGFGVPAPQRPATGEGGAPDVPAKAPALKSVPGGKVAPPKPASGLTKKPVPPPSAHGPTRDATPDQLVANALAAIANY